jgi:hypothetical protein
MNREGIRIAACLLGSSLSLGAPALAQSHEQLVAAANGSGTVYVFNLPGMVLKTTLTDPGWQPDPLIAVDSEKHLAVLGNRDTDKLYVYSNKDVLLNVFILDLKAVPDTSGAGLSSMVYGPRGTLFAVGKWLSGTYNYLFEFDVDTGVTLQAINLDNLTDGTGAPLGKFEPARVTCGKDGFLYVTEWSASGNRRVLQLDPGNPSVALANYTDTAFTSPLQEVACSDGGQLLVGDHATATLFISDPSRTTWNPLISCSGGTNDFSVFAMGHGFVYCDAGTCAGVPGDIWQVKLKNGTVQKKHSTGLGTRFSTLVIRH